MPTGEWPTLKITTMSQKMHLLGGVEVILIQFKLNGGSHLNTIQTQWCFSHGSILSDTKCHKQTIHKQQTRNNQHFDYRGQGMALFWNFEIK